VALVVQSMIGDGALALKPSRADDAVTETAA